jgi:N-methylhydantoinase A
MNSAPWRIGVDIGGTFTDLVMLDSRDGRIFNGKVLTTPHAPEEAVLEGVRDLLVRTGARADEVRHVIHGTTLVANALSMLKAINPKRRVFMVMTFRGVVTAICTAVESVAVVQLQRATRGIV